MINSYQESSAREGKETVAYKIYIFIFSSLRLYLRFLFAVALDHMLSVMLYARLAFTVEQAYMAVKMASTQVAHCFLFNIKQGQTPLKIFLMDLMRSVMMLFCEWSAKNSRDYFSSYRNLTASSHLIFGDYLLGSAALCRSGIN
jgi:hypothetical protein